MTHSHNTDESWASTAADTRPRHAIPQGPLNGVKVLEIAGMGPGPFAAALLAEFGAAVIRVHRPSESLPVDLPGTGCEKRSRPGLAVDLKKVEGQQLTANLAVHADVLLEGNRPGVMERLGLGPAYLMSRNPQLVYARMTGYGQHGPLSHDAGHDINYIALSGTLGAMGRKGERPAVPLNLLGDYGGGGLMVAFGIVCAVLDAQRTGRGQVIDASMVEGAAQLGTLIYGFAGAGGWEQRGTNLLDSGAHFYEVYETADGGYMAVGAIEPQFYAELIRILNVPAADAPQWPKSLWPELKTRFADVFATKTRAEWTALFEHTDACATPVLELSESPSHPHNVARRAFVHRGGADLPVPAPRMSKYPFAASQPSLTASLEAWGLTRPQIDALDISAAR